MKLVWKLLFVETAVRKAEKDGETEKREKGPASDTAGQPGGGCAEGSFREVEQGPVET